MRNILVVSDHFTHGGLETQVAGQARSLRQQGATLHLATSSPASAMAETLFESSTFELPMGGGSIASQLRYTIDKMLSIVRRESIDLIHAHPFCGALLAMPVAQAAELPLALTLHGPGSLYFSGWDTITGFLLAKALLPNASTVFAVSEEVRLLCRTFVDRDLVVLRNAVAIPPQTPPQHGDGLPWLWAGRLDADKIVGLQELLRYVLQCQGPVLHIYGKGPEEESLRARIKENDPEGRFLVFKGWVDDLSDHIPNYGVICGMGRVILEGAAANRPCLLVGYDGVKGFLTPSRAREASFWNMSGRGLRSVDADTLAVQSEELRTSLSGYELFEWVKSTRNEEDVWKVYLDEISTLAPFQSKMSEAFLDVLTYMGDSEEPFWESQEAFLMLSDISSKIARPISSYDR